MPVRFRRVPDALGTLLGATGGGGGRWRGKNRGEEKEGEEKEGSEATLS